LLFYQTNPFTLDRIQAAFIAAISGQVDSSCTTDYTAIPGNIQKELRDNVSDSLDCVLVQGDLLKDG